MSDEIFVERSDDDFDADVPGGVELPTHDMPESSNDPEPFVFEELTLAQALLLMVYRPARVAQELWRVIIDRPSTSDALAAVDRYGPQPSSPPQRPTADSVVPVPQRADDLASTTERNWLNSTADFLAIRRDEVGLLLVLLLAIVFSFIAAGILRDASQDVRMIAEGDTGGAVFWVVLASIMGLSFSGYQWIRQRRALNRESATAAVVAQPTLFDAIDDDLPTKQRPRISTDGLVEATFNWVERHAAALSLVPIAILLSYLAYARNVATTPDGQITGIVFTTFGFAMWVLAMSTWYLIFTVNFHTVLNRVFARDWPTMQLPKVEWRWQHVLLLIIVVVAAYMRLHRLSEVPPDMTSDHIEKLIDAVKVDNGIYAVFFENNGGREAFQMYAVAAIADWFDVGFNFNALKYATAIEGMLSIILSYWVAKEMIGRHTPERDQLGTWVGLATAMLMALSSWHIMLSRLGLRIVLTPLTVLIVTYFLIRALRDNRRADFINMGLALGLGTYFYQANRMLPILVVIAVGLTVLFKSRARWQIIWRYGVNLGFAGLIAIVAYLPMYRYSVEFEREFWNRTYGRIFGERYFDCIDPETGNVAFCRPSYGDMIDALSLRRYGPDQDMTGWEAFRTNYENAFFTYMYQGDTQWITNAKAYPALDARSAGLYMLGFVLWLTLLIRWRDIALIVVPIGIVILILPSALAIAPTLNENPSYTRLSGTAPFVFMMAALPLGLLMMQAQRIGRHATAYGAVAVVALAALFMNIGERSYEVYFEDYRAGYAQSWRPYSEIAAPLVEYTEGGGTFGNAFYVNFPHWLDHRILGSAAGDLAWPNGLFEAPDVFGRIVQNQDGPYAYDPEAPMLFYIHPRDIDDIEWLERTFPGGRFREVRIPTDADFMVYQVPAGTDWMAASLTAQTADQGCILNCLPGPR